jgi:hypothetical protein
MLDGVNRIRALAAAALLAALAACGGQAPAAAGSPSAAPAGASSPAVVVPSLLPATAAATPAATPPPAPPPTLPHVMVILMENREESSVIGRSDAPYMNQLASSYGLATHWYGVSHPSLPNYLALISGSDQGVHDDGTQYSFAGQTLVDQLAARGVGWKAYMEDMPSPCFGGPSSGRYAKKHDPFVYFRSITGTPAQCARVVPHTQLATDLAAGTAPPFLWVTPNLCNDGHDCDNRTADSWLRGEMQTVMGSAWYRQGGSVIITWDEGSSVSGCCAVPAGGQIPTIVVTAAGQRRLDAPGDHLGTLRALEEVYGVGYLAGAGSATHGDLRPLLAS